MLLLVQKPDRDTLATRRRHSRAAIPPSSRRRASPRPDGHRGATPGCFTDPRLSSARSSIAMATTARPVPPRWWTACPAPAQDLLLGALLHPRPLPIGWTRSFGVSDRHIDGLLEQTLLCETESGFAVAERIASTDPALFAPWSQRQRVHLTLARECRRHADHLETAAAHFEAAGEPAQAAEAFLAAAERHCARHRHAAAKGCFFRALALLPTDTPDSIAVRALQGLARCTSLAGEPVSAAAELRGWASAAPWSERPVVRAESSLVLAALLALEGRHVESARARRAAARDFAALGRDRECVEAALAAASGLAYAGQFMFAREAAETAVSAAGRVADPALRAQAQTLYGMILGMLGETSEAAAEIRAALALALRHRLTTAAAEAYRLLGTVQEYASHYPDEQSAFSSALAYCRKHDEEQTAGICLGCLAYSYFRSGNWRRSDDTARRVIGDRTIAPASRHVAQSVQGLLLAHRGETRPALRLLQQSLDGCREIGLLLMDFFNLLGLALVDELQARPESAATRYRALIDFWSGTDDRHDAIPGLTAAVSFFAAQGRRDDAAAAAEALDRIASLTANPESAGAAYFGAAELALLDGHPDQATAGFRRALAAYEQRELALEPIHCRLRLGAALRLGGCIDEALDHLQAARQRARRLGARPLLARADALLAPSAGRPRAQAPDGWSMLSSRQREVACEVARGLTNKEIATRLGVSVRTVDMHVAHVLARLNCRTRTEAATRLAGSER